MSFEKLVQRLAKLGYRLGYSSAYGWYVVSEQTGNEFRFSGLSAVHTFATDEESMMISHIF